MSWASEQEAAMLATAEGLLDESPGQAAAMLDQLWAFQRAHPLPGLSRRGAPLPASDNSAVWLTARVEGELSRPRYARLLPFEAAGRAGRRLRLSEAAERSCGRPGYALRDAVVAQALEAIAEAGPVVPRPVRLEITETGERLPYGWLTDAKAQDIGAVLMALGAHRAQGAGRWSLCPACGKDTGTKRGGVVTDKRQRWHCVRCQEGGSTVDAVGWVVLGRKPEGRDDLEKVGAWFARV